MADADIADTIWARDAAVLRDTVREAGALALSLFRTELKNWTKGASSPVSEADIAVNDLVEKRLRAATPDYGWLSEESVDDDSRLGKDLVWIVDPIDGTRNYTRGIPVWATLIAYADRVAVVSAPALARRGWAARGRGAYANGDRIHVSGIDRLEDATLLYGLDRPVPARAFDAWHVRGFGDFWAHMLVAEGAAEAAFDAHGLAVWDTAPLAVILGEAGGRFESPVSWNGRLDVSGLT